MRRTQDAREAGQVPPPSHEAAVLSWRVVTEGRARSEPVSEATVRVLAAGHRVIANGEGRDVAAALASGVGSAVRALQELGVRLPADTGTRLLPAHGVHDASDPGGGGRLRVRCADADGMLSRLVGVLGPHPIDHFGFDARSDGTVDVVVGVAGDAWQLQRVAAKLQRVIGVTGVTPLDPTAPR